MGQKIRILYYGDSPTAATGFGTVTRNILSGLHKTGKYDIKVLGINYWGDPHQFPYPIWPIGIGGRGDPYGRQRAADMMMKDFEFDVLMMIQDSFILQFMEKVFPALRSSKNKFTSVVYYPIDGTPKPEWVNAMNLFDHPVTYTKFGRRESIMANSAIGDKLTNIPHGVNINDFFPIGQDEVETFRKQFFGPHADKFIITNVNRNQQRKDIPRTMQTFKEFKKHRPDSFLYLHMAAQDQGWDLIQVARSMDLELHKDFALPGNFGPNQGYPLEVLNKIYNASDVVTSTTLGEGWGLSTVEAMATKTPIVFPRNTSLEEIIGESEERGYLVPSGENLTDYTVLPHDNEVLRPLTNVEALVEKLIHIHDDRDEAKQKAQTAYNWVRENMQWSKHIVPQWQKLIDDAVVKMAKDDIGDRVVSADEL